MSENTKLLQYFSGDDLAAGAWQGKYAQKNEVTPDDMHRRLAKEFFEVEKAYQLKEKEDYEDASFQAIEFLSDYALKRENLTEESIYQYFKNFSQIVPQGSIMSQLGADSIGSLSNCFVIGQPFDSYGGIFQKDEEMAQLMKRRGGVGIDISTLRPEGTLTSNAAKSSTGAVSFMHRFSNTTREVAQKGRRGALMISINVNHPDVMEFIKIKRDLSQVTGANISIQFTDKFMEAVEKDEDYFLRFPCDWDISNEELYGADYNELNTYYDFDNTKKYYKKVRAKEIWDEYTESAHGVAEPGEIFVDRHWNYSPDGVYTIYRGITTNPCGEIFMQAYDACRLIATNLFTFVKNPFTDKAEFDYKRFYEVNYEAMRLSDDLIDLEIKHIDKIIDKIDSDPEPLEVKSRERDLWVKIRNTAKSSRRTGLGFTALGDTLAALGLKYDSDEALEIIEKIMFTKMESELDCTIDLGILRGTFEGWDKHLEFRDGNTHNSVGCNLFYDFIAREFPDQADRMYLFGRRNVSWSTVAPTGTVSLMCQTTSGLEPLFMAFYIRRKKVNPGEEGVRVDFVDQNGDAWMEFAVLHPKFKDWILVRNKDVIHNSQTDEEYINYLASDKDYLQRLFEDSPWYGSTANDIDWSKRVEIQSIIQKYISHSISSTINLPESVTKEEVSKIYMESWKKGLKGVTVYREGSRTGVLVSKSISENSFEYKDAPKRPKTLDAEVHNVTALGDKFTVIVGLYDSKPYEVFVAGNNLKKGTTTITKLSRGKYEVEGNTLELDITDEEAALTRMISTALRHGADIKFIVEQLNKADGTIVSFSKAIARVLKKYIPDGEKSTVSCNDCGSDNVIFEEGCNKCLDCGSSKCG